ncbi:MULTISPECIES: redoxin domain-containing protein [unclassified Chitinophaga]|uniref:redoxin domain-containing protein n=1 Tax=unclassified Chitinophaga TaxID=2619133 RepID=UPI00300FCEA3
MMTLRHVLAGSAMLTLTVVSCTLYAQQLPFKIEGQMGKDQQGMLSIRYESMHTLVQDSVKVSNGAFQFSGQLQEPAAASLTFIPENKSVRGQFKEIFLDPATTISMKGDSNLLSTQVKGGPSQTDLDALFLQYKPLQEKGPVLEKQFKEYQEAGDEENMKRVGQELQALRVRRREIQIAFAKSHLNSFVGFSLWARQVDGFIKDPVKLEAEFNTYSPAVRNTPSGKRVAASLAIAGKLLPGIQAPDFTLNDISGKPVTLSSLKGKNVLLWFWSRNFIPFEPFSFAINKISRQCKDDNLVIVSVYCDSDQQRWLTEVEEASFQTPNIINLIHPVRLTAEADTTTVGKAYDLSMGMIPHSFLIGTDGKILVRDVNFLSEPELEIKKIINK